jgi:hypothetical protein
LTGTASFPHIKIKSSVFGFFAFGGTALPTDLQQSLCKVGSPLKEPTKTSRKLRAEIGGFLAMCNLNIGRESSRGMTSHATFSTKHRCLVVTPLLLVNGRLVPDLKIRFQRFL